MFHKAKDAKGSRPVVAFHETSPKVLWSILRKKGEEAGGMVGILDCLVLVGMVYQFPIID